MRKLTLLLLMVVLCGTAYSQTDIFTLMERTGLPLHVIERLANRYFDSVGTGRGTGYKQFQRWLYEKKFHTDDKGFLIDAETEAERYKAAKAIMKTRTQQAARGTYGTWLELGPKGWTYTSGWNPGVGRITSVAVHPSNQNVIYVSSPGGGIWKSTNAGSTWTSLVDFTSSAWMNIFHLHIDPSNQSNVYAALQGGAVIKSTNAGVSWLATGTGPTSAKKVLVHPTNSSIVFATGSNGIFRSTDGGTNWTTVHTEAKEDIEFHPTNPNIMYASGSGGTSCVWRSTNNGVTWTAITVANGITNTGRTLIGVSVANTAVVYAVQANGSLFGRMYKSTDTGKTYITTVVGSPGSGTNYFGYETNGTGTSGQATYDMAICVNPSNINEVMIGGIICWKSTNGGTSFVAQTAWSYPNSTGYNHADVHALEWIGTTIFSGSDGGVYKSTNSGGDWTDLSAGLGIRQFYRIACAKTDADVITGGAQDNGSSYRRTDSSWKDWLGADGMDNIISPTNANISIGTSQNGSIYKTTNAGQTYSNLTKPSNGNWVTPLVMHPTNHNTVYGGWTGIYRSANGGSSWTNISGGVITGMLTTLAVAPSDTQYVYGSIGATLYRTHNNGATWVTVTAPATINAIYVSPVNPRKIYLACNSTTNRVYVSSDTGRTFQNISAGLPALSARSVVVDDNVLEGIYVGMNVGVYYRDNVDTNWVEHASGLPLVAVNEVEIQKSSGKLRVATYGRGVWETNLWTPILAGTVDITDDGGILDAQYTSGSPAGEEFTKVIDNNNATKYLTPNCSAWIRYTATNNYIPKGYSIVSGNDFPDRDPKNWTLQASTNGSTWVTLHTVTNEFFPGRGQEKVYTFNNTNTYKYYHITFTCKTGSTLQVAELKIYGVQQPSLLARGSTQPSEIVVAQNEALAASGIKAFPNPVSGRLTITGLKDARMIALYDIHGKRLRTERVAGTTKELDMRRFATGTYQLIITGHDQQQTSIRIVKQ
ncbi:T9SS type A sorting domain-containing protein [Paraflavitalea sp. CAU 1676]|uniref:VPS10 domain-containing protein n=1 Tax=Paraflavitalea sp. CAU 1676 TaxID=3032598 RepID=UPI0023DC2716|nr:T9SS type A sorting domain-containing protein [Paraflavitalea sp. CAU 1676]MDF2188400.1 T9SS type A sorting domain-containing protein [Paraflavitalea sp. CAU 1676]